MPDYLPVYNFPETIFTQQNTHQEQQKHVLSEAQEIEIALDANMPEIDVDMEMADLTHSLETYWRKKEAKHGREYVHALFKSVQIKNLARGYYGQ
jgi:hypothetical protein